KRLSSSTGSDKHQSSRSMCTCLQRIRNGQYSLNTFPLEEDLLALSLSTSGVHLCYSISGAGNSSSPTLSSTSKPFTIVSQSSNSLESFTLSQWKNLEKPVTLGYGGQGNTVGKEV